MDTHHQASQPERDRGTDKTIFMTRPPLEIPLNLAEWVKPETIADWIPQAITRLDCNRPEVLNFLTHPADQRPETVLTVLVFAYLTQRFASGEIFEACHSDPVLRRLCGGKAPYADELEHFRRKNRSLVEHLTGQVLVRAVAEKFLDAGQVPPGLQHGLLDRAVEQVDVARHMSAGE
jgi:hypothetical protein